ncbi:MAG: Jag N-terminal domain-containing protein [Caldilineaceae bacterium]
MAMQAHEFKAKSVDEAIEAGLSALNTTRSAVEVEVVSKGSRGIFGIGSEPAVVRLTFKPNSTSEGSTKSEASLSAPAQERVADETAVAPIDSATEQQSGSSVEVPTGTALADEHSFPDDDAHATPDLEPDDLDEQGLLEDDELDDDDDALAEMAVDMLSELVYLMGFEAEVVATWQEEEDDYDDGDGEDEDGANDAEGTADSYRVNRYLMLDVEGTDLGALIGRRGETLDNLQYLLRLMVNQKIHRWENIVIDVERYKARRVTQLTQLAERMAEQVARSGRAISLEPMPANERRIIHMVLRDHPDVYTESYGEGPRRKVHIFARD